MFYTHGKFFNQKLPFKKVFFCNSKKIIFYCQHCLCAFVAQHIKCYSFLYHFFLFDVAFICTEKSCLSIISHEFFEC